MSKVFNRILVTGGAGFIGSHLVTRLLKDGYEVTLIDDLSRGNIKFLDFLKEKPKFLKMDLSKEEGLLKVFEGHDLVFNLAALNTGVDYDEGRTQLMFENNMLLQMIPLRVAAKTKSIKKFIQISSASVYSREVMNKVSCIKEEADTNNPEPSKLGYALAKKMGENLASWYASNSKLETISARFINVFGENDHYDQLGHFIPMMIRKIIEAEKKVEVFGSGNQSRSFVYVEDVIDALLLLAKKGKNGEIYNVDANQEKTVKEVVSMIKKYLKKDLQVNFDLSKPEGSKRRMLDSSKLRSLGWKPKTSFALALKKTIKDINERIKSENS